MRARFVNSCSQPLEKWYNFSQFSRKWVGQKKTKPPRKRKEKTLKKAPLRWLSDIGRWIKKNSWKQRPAKSGSAAASWDPAALNDPRTLLREKFREIDEETGGVQFYIIFIYFFRSRDPKWLRYVGEYSENSILSTESRLVRFLARTGALGFGRGVLCHDELILPILKWPNARPNWNREWNGIDR